MTRTADDLTQDERKRIVAGWRAHRPRGVEIVGRRADYCAAQGILLGVKVSTVRQVLREEGE